MLVTTWLSNTTFHLQPIWQQNLVVIDSEIELESFQTLFPSFCMLPSSVAVPVQFNSNLSRPQKPFLQTDHKLWSAALHRIWFGTWGLLMSHFYTETNKLSKDLAQRWQLLSCLKRMPPTWKRWVCACPSDLPKQCWSTDSRAWPLISQSKT